MLRWHDVGLLVGAYVALTALWSAVGWWVKGAHGTALGRADERIAEWWVDRRTPRLDDLSLAGSLLAETAVKIAVTALVVGVMLWWWRRWREPLVVAVSLVLEAMVFISVTWIVGRPRPDVPRLDGSPVDSSFPSGHAAAAACYAAMAVVVFWHTRRRVWRAVAVMFAVLVPLAVAVARMYRGMHHLTDVVAGMALGAAAVTITVYVVLRAEARLRSTTEPADEHLRSRPTDGDRVGAMALTRETSR